MKRIARIVVGLLIFSAGAGLLYSGSVNFEVSGVTLTILSVGFILSLLGLSIAFFPKLYKDIITLLPL